MTIAELEAALAGEQPFDVARVFISYGATASSPGAVRAAASRVHLRAAARGGGIFDCDVYQVNLVQHPHAPFTGDPVGFARTLAPAVLEGDGWAIVSASPELLLQKRGRTVGICPIKGTRPLGKRNDLSRVSVPGSVRWPELLAEREFAGVGGGGL